MEVFKGSVQGKCSREGFTHGLLMAMVLPDTSDKSLLLTGHKGLD